uniref:Uncharacterized protein n=1 Tax=Nelumbo nucifera TaxID=4432 RepID=A0A822Y007_NELNU|nr:TPA_asm: hypothetical protein HUJ06_025839 [Nelumbo nucifera]
MRSSSNVITIDGRDAVLARGLPSIKRLTANAWNFLLLSERVEFLFISGALPTSLDFGLSAGGSTPRF